MRKVCEVIADARVKFLHLTSFVTGTTQIQRAKIWPKEITGVYSVYKFDGPVTEQLDAEMNYFNTA